MAESNRKVLNLLDHAVGYIKDKYIENRHHVVCVLVANGKLYEASHLDIVGGLDICAEPIALSNAMSESNEDFEMLVTVAWNGKTNTAPWVITPCGNCRQVLSEYAPNLKVIINDEFKIILASDLLPYPYVKRAS